MKFFAALLIIAAALPNVAFAQTLSDVRGIEITPFLIEAEVEKGGNFKTQIEVTNRSESTMTVRVEPRDFLPGVEGQPRFVPDTEDNDPTFSLASWIKIQSSNSLTIEANQTAIVPFEINPPVDAEQGTHYGAVLFSFSSSGNEGNSTEVNQSVGSIILIRYGQAREKGTVDLSVSEKLLWNADKINLSNLFENTGNVHVKPKGEVYIKDMLGRIVATPFINKDAANVLPQTDRTFVNSWLPSSFAFGRYTLESVVQYGNSRLEARDREVVWILPWYVDLVIAGLLAVILWFIFHGRHWHKKRVIKRHFENDKNP